MLDEVKDYYGKELQGSEDLKTNACCTDDGLPRYIKDALSIVHDEVLAKYYGCGLIAPEALEGLRILDLGCGTGRDCYVLSQLVGESGEVVGVKTEVQALNAKYDKVVDLLQQMNVLMGQMVIEQRKTRKAVGRMVSRTIAVEKASREVVEVQRETSAAVRSIVTETAAATAAIATNTEAQKAVAAGGPPSDAGSA